MPKLPEFRTSQDMTAASRSTSMQSAFMNPQLRPMTKQHVAAQHSLTAGQRDVEAEANLAMAKYATTDVLISAVQGAAEIYGKIDNASQTMAMEKAAAEYTQGVATLSSEEIMRGGEIDPQTGLQRHFGSEDRYSTAREKLLNDVLARNKFTNKELVHNFNLKVQAADYTNIDSMRSSGNKHRIEKAYGDALVSLDKTKDPTAKKIIVDEMLANDLITEAKAFELRSDINKEQVFASHWNIIKSDNTGASSAKVMATVNTAEFINKHGATTANNLYTAAVKRYGLLAADTLVRNGVASGSKKTMDRLYLELNKKTYQEMGLPSIEAKDAVMGIISAEVTAASSRMATEAKISKKDAEQARVNTQYDQRRHYQENYGYEGTIPPTPAEQNRYWEDTYGNEPPVSVLSRPAEFQHQTRNFRAEGTVIPVVLDNWARVMNSGDPNYALAAGRQVGTIYNDPTMPVSVKQEMMKALGEENMDIATGIVNGTLSGKSLEEALTYSRSTNKDEIDANWNDEIKKYKNQKNNSTKISNGLITFMSEKLEEQKTPVSTEVISGAPVKIFEDILQRKYRAHLHGRNIDSYMNDAWAEYIATNSPEVSGVKSGMFGDSMEYRLVSNSYFASLGSTNGVPTPEAEANIMSTLEKGGRTDVLARIEKNESSIAPRKIPNTENYAMYEVLKNEDGTEQYKLLENRNTGQPLIVSRDEKFILEQGQRAFNNSAQRGIETAEMIKSSAPDTTEALINRRRLTDSIKRQYSHILKGRELAGDFVHTGVDNFYGTLWDGLAHASSKLGGLDIAGAEWEEFLKNPDAVASGIVDFGALNLDEETNDMIWKYTVDYYTNQMADSNEPNKVIYDERRIRANIADIKAAMVQRGIIDPGSR
jgi:hypothetical protein